MMIRPMVARAGLVALAVCVPGVLVPAPALDAQAPGMPSLHHAHLNSLDPQRAIDWYLDLWPEGSRGEVGGYPAFVSDMAVLFSKVDRAPLGAWDETLQRAEPQSAFWHIGAYTNTTGKLEELEARGYTVLRLWTGPDDRTGVLRSGLTPYEGIVTAPDLAAAPAAPPREGGFSYLVGPDGALVELTGGPRTTDSFSHVHLFHEEPRCAANWYVDVLGMELPPARDAATGASRPQAPHAPCAAERTAAGWPSLEYGGTIRGPSGAVRHGNGSLSFYPRQCIGGRCGADRALVPSRGQVLDHVGFAVTGLDAWMTHLASKAVAFTGPYAFGSGRAVLLETPDGLGIELVELPGG
jgi:hypothetical protein